MKTSKKKGSVFTLLVRNYILFTITLVLIIFGFLCFLAFYTIFKLGSVSNSQIINYKDTLENGNYDDFPAEQILGSEGFIAILDKDGNELYNMGNLTTSDIYDDIAFIPDFLTDDSIQHESSEFISSNGEKNYEFKYTDNRNKESYTEVYILDDQGKLLYSKPNSKYENLTKNQWLLVSQNRYDKYAIYKYRLSNLNTVLLFAKKPLELNDTYSILNILRNGFILFIFIYLLMIFIFIYWLKHKITKPLNLLCENIDSFELGDKVMVNYKGPREFVEIFDSFSRLSNTLSLSEQQRKNLEAEKQSMLANIAHDLKTPITVIQGYSKAISDGLIPLDNQQIYLDAINQKSILLNEMINSFYEYSQLEHPGFIFNFEKLNICHFSRNYLASKYSEIEADEFILDIDIAESPLVVNIDSHQFKRVFDNIISNILKYNPKGTSIYFGIVKHGDQVKITIADDGIGIASNIVENIFSPFVVGEMSRTENSTGLGLSIVEKIVLAHDGTINLIQDNSKWKTSFEIILPLYF